MSEKGPEEYWEQVQEIGELKLGESTVIKFQKGVTKRDRREVVSIRAWVAGKKYTGPTRQGFNLDLKTAEEFYNLLGKALGKSR
jgi:hypothetical protein